MRPIHATLIAMLLVGCERVEKSAPAKTDVVVPAVHPDGSIKDVVRPALKVALLPGWSERATTEGPRTFTMNPADDAAPVLQLSRLPDKDYAFIAEHPDLGSFAADMGERLHFGKALGTNERAGVMGRIGIAGFSTAEFPQIALFVVESPRAAYMWTWISPTTNDDAADQAARIVLATPDL